MSRTLNDIKKIVDDTMHGSKVINEKLTLRKKYKESGELDRSPSLDVDIWDNIIKATIKTIGK